VRVIFVLAVGVVFAACSSSSPSASDAGTDAATDAAQLDAAGDDDATDGGADVPFPNAPTGAGTGTTYYVSPSGDDTHDGKSPATAWKTVDKVNASSFGGGDSVLFEGGQSFTGCVKLGANVASTATKAFTLGAYGTGKFTLTANCSGSLAAAITVSGVSGVYVQDATIVGNAGGAEFGVWLTNQTQTMVDGLVVRRCDISGFYTTENNFGGEIFLTSDSGIGIQNVGILDNELHGASASSLDDNGVAGYGNSENIKNVYYERNSVHDIGGKPNGPNGSEGNGIVVNGVDGAVVQYNVMHDLGGNVNTCGGNSGVLVYSANDVTVQFNEAYASRPLTYTAGCDWDGFDLDGYVTNSVMQYNYSHDNYGAGFLFFGYGTWGPNTIRYNISEHDALLGTTATGSISISGGPSPMITNVYNNTVYDNTPDGTQSPALAFVNGVPTGGVIANNILYSTAHFFSQSWVLWTNATNPSGVTLVNNDYAGDQNVVIEWNGTRYTDLASWQTASGEDPKALSVDPQLTAPGTAGTCNGYSSTCAAGAYSLKTGSPMLGHGIDLTAAPYSLDVGKQNFFGKPIGGSAGYDIGAF
jgi:hypothetical protein